MQRVSGCWAFSNDSRFLSEMSSNPKPHRDRPSCSEPVLRQVGLLVALRAVLVFDKLSADNKLQTRSPPPRRGEKRKTTNSSAAHCLQTTRIDGALDRATSSLSIEKAEKRSIKRSSLQKSPNKRH